MTNPYPNLTPLEPWDELLAEQNAQLARWNRRARWRQAARIAADVLLFGGALAILALLVSAMWN